MANRAASVRHRKRRTEHGLQGTCGEAGRNGARGSWIRKYGKVKTVNPAGGGNRFKAYVSTENRNTAPISGTMGANSGKEQVNMKRMTTDNPQLNIERLLNTARAENNQAVLHLGDEVITLAEYVAKCAKERGCDITQESVMDGDNCCECDCPVAILNILGIQAAENNARLKNIEKILGNDYDLDRMKELVEADREGRCVVSPCKVGDRLYTIRTIQDGSFTLEVYDSGEIRQISVNTDGTFFLVDYGHSLSANNFGKTVFKTREAAESALKERNEN